MLIDYSIRIVERLKCDTEFVEAFKKEIQELERDGFMVEAQSMRETLSKAN